MPKVRYWCKSIFDSVCLQGCVDLNKKLYEIKNIRGKKDICVHNKETYNLSEELLAFHIIYWNGSNLFLCISNNLRYSIFYKSFGCPKLWCEEKGLRGDLLRD